MARMRSLARLLDNAIRIPGTNIRFGWDALIGLIPVLGDVAGAALAGYIVMLAARLGAPPAVIVRMLLNVTIDAIVGSVPVLGDLFDVGWMANARNVALMDRYLDAPHQVHRASRMLLGGVVVILVALTAGGIALSVLVIKLLLGWT